MRKILLVLLTSVVVFASTVTIPRPASAAPAGIIWPVGVAFSRWLPKRVCQYSTNRVEFVVYNPVNTPPYGSTASASAGSGQIENFWYNDETGIGWFDYYAAGSGSDTITVTATMSSQSEQGKLTTRVRPCGYQLTVRALSKESFEGAQAVIRLDGGGGFEVDKNGKINSGGVAEVTEGVWADSKAVSCAISPPIEAYNNFKIQGSSSGDSIQLQLIMMPFRYSAWELNCKTAEGDRFTAVSSPAGSESLDMDLTNMTFPAVGGSHKFAFYNGSGYVFISPREKK